MQVPHLHRFQSQVDSSSLPARFTFPFHYVPHKLCIAAAHEVQAHLAQHPDLAAELNQGKMLGVLVAQCPDGSIGFFAAYSGNVSTPHSSWFVPPVYNLLDPNGEFKRGEAEISEINRTITQLSQSQQLSLLKSRLADLTSAHTERLGQFRAAMAQSKLERERLRNSGNLSPAQADALISQSQFQKAELKRIKKQQQAEQQVIAGQISEIESQVAMLRLKRKRMSEALQQRIFQWFVVTNANGQSKSLADIFSDYSHRHAASSRLAAIATTPPSGSGECCAPKLLQWAYTCHVKPLCMAEFWWGQSPSAEVRHQGHFYPACTSKCRPILEFMLQGLDVESNPLAAPATPAADPLEIVWEDDWIMVVNKPAGLLTTPGKVTDDSLTSRVRQCRPSATGPLAVHRLDMATSGLVIIAKDLDTYRKLQAQFANRTVSKRYVALVDGIPANTHGTINLPLRPDPDDRPRQIVDPDGGKPASTSYRVISTHGSQARVSFMPHTGRTHQIRVHASHTQGLGTPIVGDMLYGSANSRLHLHAESVSFTHPVTGKTISVSREADF